MIVHNVQSEHKIASNRDVQALHHTPRYTRNQINQLIVLPYPARRQKRHNSLPQAQQQRLHPRSYPTKTTSSNRICNSNRRPSLESRDTKQDRASRVRPRRDGRGTHTRSAQDYHGVHWSAECGKGGGGSFERGGCGEEGEESAGCIC